MLKQITVAAGLIALAAITAGALDAARTASKRLETDGARIVWLADLEPNPAPPLAEMPSLGKTSRVGR